LLQFKTGAIPKGFISKKTIPQQKIGKPIHFPAKNQIFPRFYISIEIKSPIGDKNSTPPKG
jgi:hypothetical protein